MLKTVVIDVEKINSDDSFEIFVKNTEYVVVMGIETYLEQVILDCDSTLLITDKRRAADVASRCKMALAVYINSNNSATDFPDALYCIESIKDMSDYNLDRMYRRHRNIPWDIVETERCLVREITVDDVSRLYEIYSDEDTRRYIENLYENPEDEIKYTEEYIKNQYRFFEYGLWVVIDKNSGVLIGRAGVFNRENQEYPELGFVFDKSTWGKGFATEVLTEILCYCEDELMMDYIYANTEPENDRSIRILKKLGFEYEGKAEAKDKVFDRYIKNLKENP